MITLAVMSATLIQVLDTTIVNVALPHMAGELGASTDQVSWVLTSYLVSSAIVMPLTGYFADTLRRERRMDWTGLVLLGTGIAGLQYMLDRGTSQDWFAATDIRISALASIGGLGGFVWWSLRRGAHALFDLRIFRDRNFAMACLVMLALGLGLFGG